jgi:hypothetical protein
MLADYSAAAICGRADADAQRLELIQVYEAAMGCA